MPVVGLTVVPSEEVVRKAVSRQSSLVVDEPVEPNRSPSPARRPVSQIVHILHLVRPFTLGQLKELLGRTGTIAEDKGFWIDKIKSHCYVKVSCSELVTSGSTRSSPTVTSR